MPCPMSGPNPSSPAAASAPGNAHHERPSRRTAGRQRHRQDPEQHPGDSTRHGVHAAVIAHAAGGEGKPHGRNRARAHHSGTFRLMQRLAGPSLSLNTGPCISRRRIPPPHDRRRRTGRPPALHPPPLRHAAAHGRPPACAWHRAGQVRPTRTDASPVPVAGIRERRRAPAQRPSAAVATRDACIVCGRACGCAGPRRGRCAHGQGRSTNAPLRTTLTPCPVRFVTAGLSTPG